MAAEETTLDTEFAISVTFDITSVTFCFRATASVAAVTDFVCASTVALNPTLGPKEKSATAAKEIFRSALAESELERPKDNEFLTPTNISFFMPKYKELLMPMLWLKSVPHVSLVLLPRVMDDECP